MGLEMHSQASTGAGTHVNKPRAKMNERHFIG